ncbi:MAG: domain containing protein [Schlesneria sp.]|nr:domain containing protein [Schlesneria sp.]
MTDAIPQLSQAFFFSLFIDPPPWKRIAILSSRKPGYLFGILLLAVLCSSPQLFFVSLIVQNGRYDQFMPALLLQEWGRVQRDEDLVGDLWQDRFVHFGYHSQVNGAIPWTLKLIDPRTRVATTLTGETPGNWGPQVLVFGSRLWVIGNKSAVELVDGTFQPSSMVRPNLNPDEQQRLLLDGEPAFLRSSTPGFTIFTFNGTAWKRSYDLVLPDTVLIAGISINFKKARSAACINEGNRLHLFLDVEGRMLHHEGLQLRALAGPATANASLVESPVSALYAENMPADVAGWSVVNKTPMVGRALSLSYQEFPNHIGLLVDGKPAAIVVDTDDASAVVGHLFRFDNGHWSEFATQTFPFGTAIVRAAIYQDHQTSFVLATTSTGLLHLYEVDAKGIDFIPGTQTVQFRNFMAAHALVWAVTIRVMTLLLGGAYGLGATVLMWFYTRPDYGFGSQQVRLAGIVRRAIARLIDFGLIGLSTTVLMWWLTRDMDWLSLIEAMNLKVSHPTVESAIRIICVLILWLVVCEGLIVVAQARWGVTVGKWCCGLRVFQTSLRPCGIYRSLVREILLWVDACGLLCWTPGIASIALTDRRQRLGDIIGDTIVVTKSSMKQPPFRHDEPSKTAACGFPSPGAEVEALHETPNIC